ncbi:hypothetical protein BRADI_2g26815v3 [Brachypodium distachyon]|uniref:Uncharacterized protein n=1 Tax=Brachypodium distachyon TaxID=15368 RepID=A0A2K2DAT0_BRADI|nr:hypothetical protein BRADI_2g26815v3 [Brachypodium distachyon]
MYFVLACCERVCSLLPTPCCVATKVIINVFRASVLLGLLLGKVVEFIFGEKMRSLLV